MTENREKKNIVILGAGFGGLRAAVSVSQKIKKLGFLDKYQVVLVDRNDYQIYTPTLYEIAATSKETADYLQLKEIAAFPIKNLIKKYPIRFFQGEVEKLDLARGDIHLKNGERLEYECLVLALGAETNYFGIPGLQENSFPLKTFLDALNLRNRILDVVSTKKKGVKITIGGGGSTGVELAGEIQQWLCELREEIGECDAEVMIVEGAPSVLPGFDAKVVEKVLKRLNKIGVKIIAGEIIERAEKQKIFLKGGTELAYDVLVWTGGVRASSIMQKLPLKVEEKKKQVVAEAALECLPERPDLHLYGRIYGIGDAVCFFDKDGRPIPKIARAAIIQADIVAHNIAEDLKVAEGFSKKCSYKIFRPAVYPYVIPVGGKFAVAKIGSLVISGFRGWILKGLVELNYLFSIMGFWGALRLWFKELLIFIKNDRLG